MKKQIRSSGFKERVFHLDLRIQVMTPMALKALAKQLVELGFTTVVMEWEATFPFKKHKTLASRFVYSRKEILEFLAFCKKIGLKTMPIQQCFGHIEYILQHERYAHLKEDERDICQLCPLKIKEALPLFKDLFEELIEVHDSPYFYVGCDETYILGKCPRCAEKAKKYGHSKLYVDYLKEILLLVKKLGKRPVCPADELLKHPESAHLLPKDTILVDWNYGWPIGKFGYPEPLIKKGFTFWGSLALRSGPDNYYLHTWEKHLNNYRDFIPYCQNMKYEGIVLTSWSTSGIYGSEWEAFYEVVALHPVRRVYPLNGFNLLLKAFEASLDPKQKYSPKFFVCAYAKEHFGLSDSDAKKFAHALIANPSSVYLPKIEFYTDPTKVQKEVENSCQILHNLSPRKNQTDFHHIALMFDIRNNYLKMKKAEEKAQKPNFTEASRKLCLKTLKQVLADEKELSKRYSQLIKGYLHPAEIRTENEWRSRKLKLLIDRFERSRN